MSLSEQIKQYYFEHIDELPKDKQFHFASRIAAWQDDPAAQELLVGLRNYMAPSGTKLEGVIAELLDTKPNQRINAFSLREPMFNRYPVLYGVHLALFRVRHLKSVYGIDAGDILLESVSKQTLDELADKLAADNEALRILSTYAVNFLYLYKAILIGQSDYVDLQKIISLKDGYDLTNTKHLQLLIYLYAHCIIGETNFYVQEIAVQRKNDCVRMLEILEPHIADNFDSISLDNKLEFLVCARICGFDSRLSERILAECQTSLSDNGHFLVDKHNKNIREDRVAFDKSEHRNVLYIMSHSPYSPHRPLA